MNTQLLSKANNLMKEGKFSEAERIYVELLIKHPNDATIQAFLGRLYVRQLKFKSAERILQKSYDTRKSAASISALAYCKYKLNKFDDAIILYEELFKYDNDNPKIYNRIIDCFRELQMYNFEIAYAQKFYEKHPELDNAMVRLTQSYLDKGEVKIAEDYCAKTIQKYPNCAEIWIVAGTLQEFLYCNEELAQECYYTAIENGSIIAYYHLAISYIKTDQFDKAEENLKKAIEFLPHDSYPKAALGSLYLYKKDIKGYELFSYRENTPEISYLKNKWDGTEQRDKNLLLYCDQGLGDHIQFIRYLPFLKDKFNSIYVLTRKPCLKLFQRNFPEFKFFDNLSEVPSYDCFVLSSDLPYHLNIDFYNIPSADKYLTANEEKKEEFKIKYFNNDSLKIGLCWRAGGMGLRGPINRTINIDYFKKLLELPDKNIRFYSVQIDDIFNACEKYPQIQDLKGEIQDFEDTASIIDNCDIFITADTSCAHLAGALGKKTFLMIPYCADWRWFNNDTQTEWYSSVELFKQKDRQDWFIEVDKIIEKIG